MMLREIAHMDVRGDGITTEPLNGEQQSLLSLARGLVVIPFLELPGTSSTRSGRLSRSYYRAPKWRLYSSSRESEKERQQWQVEL
jgi:hypothetical protein